MRVFACKKQKVVFAATDSAQLNSFVCGPVIRVDDAVTTERVWSRLASAVSSYSNLGSFFAGWAMFQREGQVKVFTWRASHANRND